MGASISKWKIGGLGPGGFNSWDSPMKGTGFLRGTPIRIPTANPNNQLTLPETNSKHTWKWMVGRRSGFLLGRLGQLLRGKLAVSFREDTINWFKNHQPCSRFPRQVSKWPKPFRLSRPLVEWWRGVKDSIWNVFFCFKEKGNWTKGVRLKRWCCVGLLVWVVIEKSNCDYENTWEY